MVVKGIDQIGDGRRTVDGQVHGEHVTQFDASKGALMHCRTVACRSDIDRGCRSEAGTTGPASPRDACDWLADGRGDSTPLLAGQCRRISRQGLNTDMVGAGLKVFRDPAQDRLFVAPGDDRVEQPIADLCQIV